MSHEERKLRKRHNKLFPELRIPSPVKPAKVPTPLLERRSTPRGVRWDFWRKIAIQKQLEEAAKPKRKRAPRKTRSQKLIEEQAREAEMNDWAGEAANA